jgi:transposase-like protein
MYYERFRPNQRRFLLARMDTDSDAEACRRAHISPHTLYNWRRESVPFETVYQEIMRATPGELQTLQVYRLQEVANSCIETMEDALSADPDPDEIKSGVFDAKLRKGTLALNMMKEIRVRTPASFKKRGIVSSEPVEVTEPTSPDAIAKLTMGNR